MKKIGAGFFICLVVCSLGLSCRQLEEKLLPAFTVNIPVIKLIVPPLPLVSPREIPVGALRTHINMDSTIKAHTAGTFSAKSVHFVRVKKITIRASNADKATNLSNFETARITIYSDTSSTDLVTIIFPKTCSDSITIVSDTSADISNYLRGSNLAYNVFWKNRKKTHKYLKLEVQVTVAVQ